MKQGRMVILDSDREYGKRLGEYFNNCDWMAFQAEVFTNAEAMEACIQKWKPDLILVNEALMKEEYREFPLMVLNETLMVAEMDFPQIYKYQSGKEIGREILSWYAAQEKRTMLSVRQEKLRIYGFYSIDKKREKTVLAWETGKYLAKTGKTLYISLEPYSGMQSFLGEFSGENLADLFFFARQKQGALGMRLQGMVETAAELDFLPPATAWEDIQEIGAEEWRNIITEIENYTDYQNLILEISEVSADFYLWLQLCNKIFMPVSDEMYGQARLKEMQNFLNLRTEKELLSKWQVCAVKALRQGKEFAKEYQEEIQNYVKALIEEAVT